MKPDGRHLIWQPTLLMQGLIRSTLVRGWVPTLLRAGRGMSRYERARDDAPVQPLQLYDYDANQFSRL